MSTPLLNVALPVLFAVFVWWFSTGIVLLLDGLPRTTFRWSHLLSTLLGLGAFVGLAHTAPQTTPAGAFCAFTCALLVWGWHELSFLTGWVTGPRQHAADPGAQGWQRFVQAVQAILWHELAILASGLMIVAITWGAPNQIGTQTFAVLWVMRISAKLNVFLGVRNLSIELLPSHLAYLASFFRKRAMNLLFPVSVSASTVIAVWMVNEALDSAAGGARAIGLLLVATLLWLAILEHWLLVLPLQATALWQWAMRNRDGAAPAAPEPLSIAPMDADEKLLHAR
ncbi:MAG TPA: putative photosynthetic complex assembly protein PuhE [Piscinibacter sp.]|nr:putative photosynthetic complex assembly protein PuhE [Piscinibacter sp.]